MKIINTDKEFVDFYCYKSPPNPPVNKSVFPKRYPCIVEQINREGGLGGDWVEHIIIYFPKRVDHDAFLQGYIKGRSIRD